MQHAGTAMLHCPSILGVQESPLLPSLLLLLLQAICPSMPSLRVFGGTRARGQPSENRGSAGEGEEGRGGTMRNNGRQWTMKLIPTHPD